MTQKYLPKVDAISILITITVLLSIAVVCKMIFSSFDILSSFILIVLLVAVLAVLGSFPVAYILNDNALVIKKAFSKKAIELNTIKSVTKIHHSVSFTYSTKGFFGYLGKTMDGSVSYVTSLKNNLLITTHQNKKYIISPTKTNIFIEELNKQLPT